MFTDSEPQHFVDPSFDVLTAPYDKWHQGKQKKFTAKQRFAVRRLQDPNDGLFVKR